MVTDYKQVMKDRTTGSEIFGAWMKDVTCRTVAGFRNQWPNKVPKDRRGAGVRQKKNLSKSISSKEIRTRLRLTSHGSSVLNVSKFDGLWTVGFDWNSEKPPHVYTRRKITRTKQHRRSKSWDWQGGGQPSAFLKFFFDTLSCSADPVDPPSLWNDLSFKLHYCVIRQCQDRLVQLQRSRTPFNTPSSHIHTTSWSTTQPAYSSQPNRHRSPHIHPPTQNTYSLILVSQPASISPYTHPTHSL